MDAVAAGFVFNAKFLYVQLALPLFKWIKLLLSHIKWQLPILNVIGKSTPSAHPISGNIILCNDIISSYWMV